MMKAYTYIDKGNFALLESPCYERWYDFPFSSDSTICIIVNSGHMMCTVDTITHSIDSSGMMILTHGHIVESIMFESDFKGKFIIMSQKMLDRLEIVSQFNLLQDIETKGFYPLDDESMQAMNNYFGMLQGIIRTANPYKANVIKHLTLAYLYGLGAYIHPSLAEKPKNRFEEITNRFLELVRENCKEHRDIPFYADILSFANPSDFGKYFKKHAGCSPLAFRKLGA